MRPIKKPTEQRPVWLKVRRDRKQSGGLFSRRTGRERLIGRTKGDMNTKLHAICDSQGRSFDLFVTSGQVSDYIGARALLRSLPNADWLLDDRGLMLMGSAKRQKTKGYAPAS